MFNKTRIKIHKLLLGKPPKPKFVNPYAKPEAPILTRHGKATPSVKPRNALLRPFIAEMVNVVREDKKRLKDWVLMKPKAIAASIGKRKTLAEEYAAFEELVYRK